MNRKALFSLNQLEKVEDFAKTLIHSGWEIIASRETEHRLLTQQLPVTDIAAFVGITERYPFPPTLHPKIEMALTGNDEPRIDLVYVIPYPRSSGNDVGGRTLLALAAKGNRIPVMDIKDMETVVEQISKSGCLDPIFHQHLIHKTNKLIARHYADLTSADDQSVALFFAHHYQLKNGENPYQVPSDLLSESEPISLSIPSFRKVAGESPCFTNIADADSILDTLCRLSEGFYKRFGKTPFMCIAAKHGNACGAAYHWNDPIQAIDQALFGNPRAVWGGEVIVNFAIDATSAESLFKSARRKEILGTENWMLDLILAPQFSPDALDILGKRTARKLLEHEGLFKPLLPETRWSYRMVRGGVLRQPPANYILNFEDTHPLLANISDVEAGTLLVAWAAAWSANVGGNEVAIAKDARLLGIGGGPSTVDAALTAVRRAHDCGHDLEGSYFAVDAFFPHIDAPEILVQNGIKCGIAPSGGINGGDIEEYFRRNGVNVVFLPEQYRGFCRH